MKYTTNRTMNVRTLKKLANNEGVTLRNGKIVTYKSGWQVAITGVKCMSAEEAMLFVRKLNKIAQSHGIKNVGVWVDNCNYYVDICRRIPTKKEAVKVGKDNAQLSIYYWGKRKESLEWL